MNAVSNKTLEPVYIRELEQKEIENTFESFEDFIEKTKNENTIEGYVLYLNNMPVMRVKTNDYKIRHQLRFQYPASYLMKTTEKKLLTIENKELKEIVLFQHKMLKEKPELKNDVVDMSRKTVKQIKEIILNS